MRSGFGSDLVHASLVAGPGQPSAAPVEERTDQANASLMCGTKRLGLWVVYVLRTYVRLLLHTTQEGDKCWCTYIVGCRFWEYTQRHRTGPPRRSTRARTIAVYIPGECMRHVHVWTPNSCFNCLVLHAFWLWITHPCVVSMDMVQKHALEIARQFLF